jgi:hypothetical protein
VALLPPPLLLLLLLVLVLLLLLLLELLCHQGLPVRGVPGGTAFADGPTPATAAATALASC